jgi:uncharacterized integral membrane protein
MSEYGKQTMEEEALMARAAELRTVTVTRAQEIYTSWATDLLIYVVVLNLFVEYVDAVIIDSFTISILTALLLKIILELVGRFEHRVHHFFEKREGSIFKILGPVVMFSILFLSKFLILEVVDIVFGEHVELGHFIEVVALIISMLLARALAVWIYKRLGVDEVS